TDTRSTAVILSALVRLDPQNELIPQVVRWLMVARKDGIWETTQETAWAIIALTDWMVETQELKGQYEYGVALNERTLTEGSVSAENVDQPVQLSVAIADLLAGASNRLAFERGPGEGRLYYTAHLNVYLPVEEIEPLDRGVIVSRQYCQPSSAEGADDDTAPTETRCEPISEAGVSDVVEVRLTIIAPHDLYYVVVEDPLPAGGEAIDTSLATTSVLEQEAMLMRAADEEWSWLNRWWWRWYSRSEMRDDRVVLFADYLPAGTYEYTYTFRATQAGEYRVIPTTAREFYFPEVFGRGAGSLFSVHEAQ
ncbi:MAG: alpha-2-macroglobulin, partial [Anaerolineales bacterium]|nr:alpha-2-macroglobulin [Anaerolineales bacterium]